ncbi:MAG: hypothetical protein U9R47_00745, partial [Actinomycetota bacterium]|nr:hypothetical protein [Actinomycetota bacterium]
MTDDRGRLSPSDELLREALQRVKDGELDSDDFVRTPRGGTDGTDGHADPPFDVTPDDATDADSGDLSAVDIAEELAEAHATAEPSPEGAGAPTPEPPAEGRSDDTGVGMDFLPE